MAHRQRGEGRVAGDQGGTAARRRYRLRHVRREDARVREQMRQLAGIGSRVERDVPLESGPGFAGLGVRSGRAGVGATVGGAPPVPSGIPGPIIVTRSPWSSTARAMYPVTAIPVAPTIAATSSALRGRRKTTCTGTAPCTCVARVRFAASNAAIPCAEETSYATEMKSAPSATPAAYCQPSNCSVTTPVAGSGVGSVPVMAGGAGADGGIAVGRTRGGGGGGAVSGAAG